MAKINQKISRYFILFIITHSFKLVIANEDKNFRSLLGELSSTARLRGFSIQLVIASDSEAMSAKRLLRNPGQYKFLS